MTSNSPRIQRGRGFPQTSWIGSARELNGRIRGRGDTPLPWGTVGPIKSRSLSNLSVRARRGILAGYAPLHPGSLRNFAAGLHQDGTADGEIQSDCKNFRSVSGSHNGQRLVRGMMFSSSAAELGHRSPFAAFCSGSLGARRFFFAVTCFVLSPRP